MELSIILMTGLVCIQFPNVVIGTQLDEQRNSNLNSSISSLCRCAIIKRKITCINCDPNGLERAIKKVTTNEPNLFRINLNVTILMFPTKVLPAQWYIHNVDVNDLSITDKYINDIDPNAFNTPAFTRTLRMLKLEMPLEILRNGTFSGLSIALLELRDMKILIIETDALLMFGKISYLGLEGCEINITNLGKLFVSLPTDIATIAIEKHKLLDNIPQELFSKIGTMTELLLIESGITSIERNSFDSFVETLEKLWLYGNLLKTLPEGALPYRYFDNSRAKRKELTLFGNPWHCSCDLDGLKKLMLRFPEFFPYKIRCMTPIHLTGKLVERVDLCYKPNYCHSKSDVVRPAISKSMGVYVDSRHDFMLTLNSSVNHYYLIWFEATTTTTTTSPQCIALKKGNVSIKLRFTGEPKQQNIYTFCMMAKSSQTTNLIDCMTFTRKHHTIWLSQQMQIIVLSSFLIACCLVPVATAAVIIVFNRIYTRNKKTNNGHLNLTKRTSTKSNQYRCDEVLMQFPRSNHAHAPDVSRNSRNAKIDEHEDGSSVYYEDIGVF